MKLRFTGMLPCAVKGIERLIVSGETIEVPDDIGNRLLSNEDWQKVPESFRDEVKTKPATATKKKKAGLTTENWPTGG